MTDKPVKFTLDNPYHHVDIYINPAEVESIVESTRQKGECFITMRSKVTYHVLCDATVAFEKLYPLSP
jgi:hypothetical protein